MNGTPGAALQLYSVRKLDEPLADIVRRVAAAGYDGVEFAHRFHEESPEAVATALDDTGVVPVGVHASLSVVESALDGRNDLLERCRIVGCEKVILPHLSSNHFRSRRTVRSLSHRLRDVATGLDEHGIDLGTHNVRHYLWPLLPDVVGTLVNETPIPYRMGDYVARVAGRVLPADPDSIPTNTGLWNLLARRDIENHFFEVEVAEILAAGFDPVAMLPQFAGRVELIHLRDVAPVGRFGAFENVAHGEGLLDVQGTIDAAREAGVEWVVYEDELDRDPLSKIHDGAALMEKHLSAGATADGHADSVEAELDGGGEPGVEPETADD